MSAGIGQALEVLWRTLATRESNPLKSFRGKADPDCGPPSWLLTILLRQPTI